MRLGNAGDTREALIYITDAMEGAMMKIADVQVILADEVCPELASELREIYGQEKAFLISPDWWVSLPECCQCVVENFALLLLNEQQT